MQRQEQIKVQELEILRREKELVATVQKAAEAERGRNRILAEAERQRLAREAAGHADATRAQGTAEAEILRTKGTAEADIIKAKGQAEADAMHVRAGAYQDYNEAAIVDRMISSLPEIARAMAESFNKVDRITIVSGGEGSGGASSLTNEVTRMVAQLPAVVETLTGMKISDMLDRVQGIRNPGKAAMEQRPRPFHGRLNRPRKRTLTRSRKATQALPARALNLVLGVLRNSSLFSVRPMRSRRRSVASDDPLGELDAIICTMRRTTQTCFSAASSSSNSSRRVLLRPMSIAG